MKWLVAALYTFSAVVMFVSITFIYNLNKKKVEQMNAELAVSRAKAAETAEAEVEVDGEEVVVINEEVAVDEVVSTENEE